MKNSKLFGLGLLNALGVTAYIFLISLILNGGGKFFGSVDNKFLSPIIFLLLFVFSALLTGFLVLGRPLMLYLDGAKKEALKLFFYTGICLFSILIVAIIALMIIR